MREYRRQFRDHPDRMLSALDAATRLRLLDGEVITPQDADAVVETQTAESMCRELGAALPTSLMVGPDTVAAHLDGWSVGTSWSGAPVPGSVYEPIAGREEGTLVVGPEGVSGVRTTPAASRFDGRMSRHASPSTTGSGASSAAPGR